MKKFVQTITITFSAILMIACAAGSKKAYVSTSEGLPAGQMWKCNPVFGDVDRDGLLDLAAISRKGDGAHVWINTNNKSWIEESDGLLLNGSCGGGVDFGDVNNDGYLDLAVGDHCKGVFVYLGDGTGKWKPVSKALTHMPADDVAFGDINGDGIPDLAACSAVSKGIAVFLGDGNGGWRTVSYPNLPDTDSCHELVLGDFNQDGVLDFAAPMLEKPHVWISSGKGLWKDSSSDFPEPSWGGQYWGVAMGDVNEDGHLDLAFGRIVAGPEVFLGDGKGGWKPANEGLSGIQSAWGVALGDTDNDGHLDLVVSGKKSLNDHGDVYGVFLFRGDGKGNWKLVADSGLPETGLMQGWGIALADIDADGVLEIGGCFGSAGIQPLPIFLPGARREASAPGKDIGPGGCIQVWKLEEVR